MSWRRQMRRDNRTAHALRQVILALGLVLALAACANDGASTPAEPANGAATGTAAAEAEPAADADAGTEPAGDEAAGPYEHLARAEAGELTGTSVTIMAQWVDAEGDNFAATVADFAERTGIEIDYQGVADYETVLNVQVEGGNAPDIAQLAQPGLMRQFADGGHLVDLSAWLDTGQISADYSEAWTDLVSHDGGMYGVFFRANTKSIVWYPVEAFEAAGYRIPQTWDDLLALTEQIRADGGAPWCVAQEHGDASGWVATDWIEDVLLRTAGPEVYDRWVAHEIPFDAPEVLEAADIVADLWFTEGNVFGGSTNINATFVGDAMNPMFDEAGPKCWLHKQAAWIPDFWPKDPTTEEPLFTPGEDSTFFYLPGTTPDDRPVLGSGDLMVAFDDRPEVRAVMEYLATADAAKGWIEAGGFISPNASIPPEWYADPVSAAQAEILASATSLSFDASDSMPAEVGQGTFWSGMVEWVSADGEGTEETFAAIEASWPQQ